MDIQGTYLLLQGENVQLDLGRVAENDIIDIQVITQSQFGLSVILHILGEPMDERKKCVQLLTRINVSIRVSGVNGSMICCITNLDEEAAIKFELKVRLKLTSK